MTHRQSLNRGTRGSIRNGIVNQPKSLFHGEPKFAKDGDIIKLKSGQELKVVSGGSRIKFVNGKPTRMLVKGSVIAKDSSGSTYKVNLNKIHGVL